MSNDPLDLRELGLEEAARAFHKWLSAHAAECGFDPEAEVSLQDPDTCEQYIDHRDWRVCWESGPWKWAINLSLGKSLYWLEDRDEALPPDKIRSKPEVLLNGPHYWVEPYYGSDLMFREL